MYIKRKKHLCLFKKNNFISWFMELVLNLSEQKHTFLAKAKNSCLLKLSNNKMYYTIFDKIISHLHTEQYEN